MVALLIEDVTLVKAERIAISCTFPGWTNAVTGNRQTEPHRIDPQDTA